MVLFHGTEILNVALIRRTFDGSVHSGQIALPGGGRIRFVDTAKRGLYEEIGVNEEKYKVIKNNRYLYSTSNFYVQPYLAVCHKPVFYKQKNEVEVLQVPIEHLLDDSYLVNARKLKSAYNTEIEVPAFKFGEDIV